MEGVDPAALSHPKVGWRVHDLYNLDLKRRLAVLCPRLLKCSVVVQAVSKRTAMFRKTRAQIDATTNINLASCEASDHVYASRSRHGHRPPEMTPPTSDRNTTPARRTGNTSEVRGFRKRFAPVLLLNENLSIPAVDSKPTRCYSHRQSEQTVAHPAIRLAAGCSEEPP